MKADTRRRKAGPILTTGPSPILETWNLKPFSGERDLGLPHRLDHPLGRPDQVRGLPEPHGLHDPGPAPEVGGYDPRLV